MKILFVFTGGTIGSTLQGGFITPTQGAPYLLLERYREKYGISFIILAVLSFVFAIV